MFNFREGIPPERQDELLEYIRSWPGARSAAHLSPHAKRADIYRMCFVYVEPGVDVDNIRKRLAAMPEVEAEFIPPKRRLIW